MATGDAFDQFQTLIREQIVGAVENLQIPREDPMPRLAMSAKNVAEMGRITDLAIASMTPGYEASWRVKLQNGGLVTGAPFGATQISKMGPGTNLVMGLAANSLHTDPTKAPQPSYLKLKSKLKKMKGTYALNFEQLESKIVAGGNMLVALAMDVVSDITELVRGTAGSLFWGNGYGVMGEVDASGGETIAEGSTNWISIKNSQIFRFVRGQRYVAASLSSGVPTTARAGTLNTPGVMRCTGVNARTLEVGFESEPGEGNISLTDGDGIILEGMYDFASATSLAPNGIESLLKVSGAFPDSDVTDIENYPELQAFVDGDESNRVAPEGKVVTELLDLMTAGAMDNTPPLLVAENSLWTCWSELERQSSGMTLTPQGQPYVANGGIRAPVYTYGSRSFAKLDSIKCRPGTLFGLDPQTLVRFMPDEMAIRWRMANGGLAGQQSIMRPITVGPVLTDLSAAEYDVWGQLSITRPNQNVKRIGLYNQRTYNASAA